MVYSYRSEGIIVHKYTARTWYVVHSATILASTIADQQYIEYSGMLVMMQAMIVHICGTIKLHHNPWGREKD